ncbi:MAG: DNA-directed RNA polymerase, subunit E'' [Crenarchaeota archaeon]|nr:DNA-directed RNA polymerase, subunit E'' [Thermoproteota archaeon]
MPIKRKPFKACRRCKALVDKEVEICPICGSNDFTDEWEGVVIIIDPEKSLVAKMLGIEKPGRYAIKVA